MGSFINTFAAHTLSRVLWPSLEIRMVIFSNGKQEMLALVSLEFIEDILALFGKLYASKIRLGSFLEVPTAK